MKMNFKKFIDLYKDFLFKKMYNEPFSDEEIEDLFMMFSSLSEEDKKSIFKLAINSLKRCDEDPLSKQDLVELRKHNIEELTNLKIWFFKLIVRFTGAIFVIIGFTLIMKLIPSGLDGIANLFLELKDLIHTMFGL